jgi:N-acyl-D-amino-acid deacylase
VSVELVIRNGTILDGSGGKPYVGDVAIEGGRIAALGSVPATECPQIEAAGLYVAPGFIDIHSHSDYTLLVDPRALSAIHQGVTLEVVGNCGFGCFPIRDPELARKAIYGYSEGVPIDWRSAGGYFERLDEARPAVNVLSLVPNGQLRLSSVGLADRPAEAGELAAMQALLEESLQEGAWGYSTGLEYAQEAGASEQEIEALCRSLAHGGGVLYATHTRRRDEGATDSVAEAIRTADAAGVRLQVSHLVPRNGIEEARRSTELVELARARGLDVEFDMHTRRFGLTHLYAALPPWALAAEQSELGRLLRDPAARERMRPHRSILSAGGNWRRIVLLDNPFWPQYARRDLASIAAERGQDALDTVYDLLAAGVEAPHRLMVIIHAYDEQEQREAFAHPLCVPGSDATTLAPDGPLADSCFHGAYTWASWFYRFMVRDERLLSPAQAVHKLTAQPAARLGLSDRGTLAPRAFADVAVFDPARFAERGTTFEPNQLAEGMVHVLVNGVHTLCDGQPTGARGGKALRR